MVENHSIIGKKKCNYILRFIKYAKKNNISTIKELEIFTLELREQSKNKTKKLERKKIYTEYINSRKWFSFRMKYIKKYGEICQICRIRNGQHLHHMTYRRLGNELDKDVLFLCIECHHDIHHGEKGDKTTKEKQLLINYEWVKKKYNSYHGDGEVLPF